MRPQTTNRHRLRSCEEQVQHICAVGRREGGKIRHREIAVIVNQVKIATFKFVEKQMRVYR